MVDTPLLDRIGLDEAGRRRLLGFLDITDADRRNLAELSGFLEAIVDELVERFYEYVLSFPETAAFLEDPSLVERLKRAQRAHFLSLAAGVHDADYFESRLRVGLAHAQIRLEPQWYLGGYTVQLGYLMSRMFAEFGARPDTLQQHFGSLLKVVMLDITLATDAYIYGGFVERSLAEAHAHEAERATEALLAKEHEEARREELLGMVVHDIRSPVTAMMATARVGLRRSPDTGTPPGKQFGLIEDSGRNVLEIIDNMLTVARMSQGEMPAELERLDVAELVRSCVEELKPYAHQSGHGVTLEAAAEVPAAALDRMLVRRIVSNLLVNAFRHTPAETQVLVGCRGEGDRCVITIADDGPGLSGRVIDRVFGPAAAPAAQGGGRYVDSGLGLPFCRMACERLGGTIRVDDTVGRGACFVVDLPMS